LTGTVKVVICELPSITETVEGDKVTSLIVADAHGSTIVIVNTVLSASLAGVKVVDPPGPLELIVKVLESLIGYVPASVF